METIAKPVEKYTPTILHRDDDKAYVEFLLELPLCGACGVPMLPGKISSAHYGGVFPNWNAITADAQRERAGLGVRSALVDKEKRPLCQECAQAGKATFVCALCNQERPSSQEHESFGHPDCAEYLCVPCYETVPAKAWDEKTEALQGSHKYDWE